jgi:hypothetical protein
VEQRLRTNQVQLALVKAAPKSLRKRKRLPMEETHPQANKLG